MSQLRKLAVVVVAIALPFWAHAIPISYDEVTDGDLSSGININNLLDLGVGANRVSGSFSVNDPNAEDPGPGADFDSVFFRVADNTLLRKIQVSISSNSGIFETQYDLSSVALILPSLPRNFIGWSPEISIPTSDFLNLSFGSESTFGAGAYFLRHSYIGSFGFPGVRSADYTFKFIVTRVPEPGTLALLGIGLFGIGLSRRMRRLA